MIHIIANLGKEGLIVNKAILEVRFRLKSRSKVITRKRHIYTLKGCMCAI